MPDQRAQTGWGAVAWIYPPTFAAIYPDGSVSRLERGTLEFDADGNADGADGWTYRQFEPGRAGGHLRYVAGLDDLVNTKTGEAHLWPSIEDCTRTFENLGPRRVGGRDWWRVVCEGPRPDPLCGRMYPSWNGVPLA
jgi:hypothetical protein